MYSRPDLESSLQHQHFIAAEKKSITGIPNGPLKYQPVPTTGGWSFMRHALDIDTMTPSEHHQNQMLKTAYEANYSLTGDGLDGWRDGWIRAQRTDGFTEAHSLMNLKLKLIVGPHV